MVRLFQTVRELGKLSFNPVSIVSPIPLLAFCLFSLNSIISGEINPVYLLYAGVFSILSHSGANLWNHVNDVEVDRLQGKKNAIIEGLISGKTVMYVAILFYAISGFMVFYYSGVAFILYLVWAGITWIYSDLKYAGKRIRRLKEYPAGEIITYAIATPAYVLVLWGFFSGYGKESLIVSTAFGFLGLSGLFLKDIKDISGDEMAGLKTLGVVYPPSLLLRISSTFLITYYLIFILSPLIGGFPAKIEIVIIPFSALLLYTIPRFVKDSWEISIQSINAVRVMSYSTFLSVILLSLLIFIHS